MDQNERDLDVVFEKGLQERRLGEVHFVQHIEELEELEAIFVTCIRKRKRFADEDVPLPGVFDEADISDPDEHRTLCKHRIGSNWSFFLCEDCIARWRYDQKTKFIKGQEEE